MSEILSKGAFAIRCGRLPSAVSQWLARGKLSGAALTADGRIVVEEAERQLALTIDPGRGAPRPAAPPTTKPNDASASLAEIRLARETLMLEAQERAAAIERAELVPVAEVTRRWAAELDDLLMGMELFVTELPPKLGLGREAVELARREFREFRRRRATAAAETRERDAA